MIIAINMTKQVATTNASKIFQMPYAPDKNFLQPRSFILNRKSAAIKKFKIPSITIKKQLLSTLKP
jgi:hypothetical protein